MSAAKSARLLLKMKFNTRPLRIDLPHAGREIFTAVFPEAGGNGYSSGSVKVW